MTAPPTAFVPVLEERLSWPPGQPLLPLLAVKVPDDAAEAGLPILTEVLSIRLGTAARRGASRLAVDPPRLLDRVPDPPRAAAIQLDDLEARLRDELAQTLAPQIHHRVHATVVPAVEMLADRLAHRAAQEAGEAVLAALDEDIRAAVHRAVQAWSQPDGAA